MYKKINQIENFIKEQEFEYKDIFCGVASYPKERLFENHKIDMNSNDWAYDYCDDVETARKVQKHFLDKGCKGSNVLPSSSSNSIYIYKMNPNTRQ